MSIPRRDPAFTSEALQQAANRFIDAGFEYWEACHKSGLVGGAVIWCADGKGRMALFTRGEYRRTILQNIDSIGSAHEFGSVNPRLEDAP